MKTIKTLRRRKFIISPISMAPRIQKWGNSLAVRIPKECADEACLVAGNIVEINSSHGQLIIKRLSEENLSFNEMLEQIPIEGMYGRENIEWGPDVGEEKRWMWDGHVPL